MTTAPAAGTQILKVVVAALILGGLVGCQSGAMVTSADLDRLTGPEWTGNLTYRDYTTDKKTSIESTLLVVKQAGLAEVGNDFADAGVRPSWDFRIGYPREPKMNSSEEIKISPGGRQLGDETVRQRQEMSDGTLRLVTEKRGTDNDNPAQFRFVYTITDTVFTITKLVKPDSEAEFFERNEYRWMR